MIKEINFSKKAVERINQLISKKPSGTFFRIAVKGGGCSGLQYNLEFVDGPNEMDFGEEQHGVNVIIDPFSAAHLEGTIIDYVETIMDSGFKFENPHATRTCGCGSSFSP